MASPHSIERIAATTGQPPASTSDITRMALYTLVSMSRQSIGVLAMQYKHVGTDDPRYIAYATGSECRYGHRFAYMHRHQQAFVMAHESLHPALGHIQQGALLFKRDPKRFSFKIYNIACDAIINHICSKLPSKKQSPNIQFGVAQCEELGIVNWDDVCKRMAAAAAKAGIDPDPVFSMEVAALTSQRIYHSMMHVIRALADRRRSDAVEQGWDDLASALGDLVRRAKDDPEVVFVEDPIRLGPADLHDALAGVVRTFTQSDVPADLDGQPSDSSWAGLTASLSDLIAKASADPSHSFTQNPPRRSSGLWNELSRIKKLFSGDDSSEDDSPPAPDLEEDIIDQLADELNAHDDLREAIDAAATESDDSLTDDFNRAQQVIKSLKAGAQEGDAILEVGLPDGLTATPWRHATRRMLSTALVSRIRLDPSRMSRRTVSAAYEARQALRRGERPLPYLVQPKLVRKAPAKNVVFIIDTSGSIYADRPLLVRFLNEVRTLAKRFNAVLTIIFADAGVCEVIEVGEAYDLISVIKPKGGGGTDFAPALEKAEEFKPDVIVYATDLMGSFPEKPPKAPVIWAYPSQHAHHPTPFGQRLELAE